MAFPWPETILALTGLGGVAVGGAITYAIEKRKWDRDQQAQACADILAAGDSLWGALTVWLLAGSFERRLEAAQQVGEASSGWFRTSSRAALLLPKSTREAMQGLAAVLESVQQAHSEWTINAHTATRGEHDDYDTAEDVPVLTNATKTAGALTRWNNARAAFIEQARSDLNIK